MDTIVIDGQEKIAAFAGSEQRRAQDMAEAHVLNPAEAAFPLVQAASEQGMNVIDTKHECGNPGPSRVLDAARREFFAIRPFCWL